MSPDKSNPIPIPTNASEVERWWLTARGQTFRQMPIESAISLPVPVWLGDRLCLAAFYFGVQRSASPAQSQAMPPLARLTATYPDCRLMGFVHREMKDLFPGLPTDGPLGELPGGGPAEGKRIINARRALLAAYGPVLEGYRSKEFSAEARQAFLKDFMAVAESPLLLYYRALNPDFFAWLES